MRHDRTAKGQNSLPPDGPAFATRAIHHGYARAVFANALHPPLFLTSTYGFDSVSGNDAAAALGRRLYAGECPPTTAILETRLATLEGAEAGLALAAEPPGVANDLIRLSGGLADLSHDLEGV